MIKDLKGIDFFYRCYNGFQLTETPYKWQFTMSIVNENYFAMLIKI